MELSSSRILWPPTKSATNTLIGLLNKSMGEANCSIRPSFITTPTVASANASSCECVTCIKVIPQSRCICFNSALISIRNAGSNADKGSSSNKIFGFVIKALAKATRCFCPPES